MYIHVQVFGFRARYKSALYLLSTVNFEIPFVITVILDCHTVLDCTVNLEIFVVKNIFVVIQSYEKNFVTMFVQPIIMCVKQRNFFTTNDYTHVCILNIYYTSTVYTLYNCTCTSARLVVRFVWQPTCTSRLLRLMLIFFCSSQTNQTHVY